MTRLIDAVKLGIMAATAVGGVTLMSASPASADVACNRYHECWHVKNRIDYPARLGIRFFDDAWAAHHRRGYHWRADRDDHGYYLHGHWRTF